MREIIEGQIMQSKEFDLYYSGIGINFEQMCDMV